MVTNVAGNDLSQMVFCDFFAGTGIVERTFKPFVKFVFANDVEYYSNVLNRNYIGNTLDFPSEGLIEQLNSLTPIKVLVFEEYYDGGAAGRSNSN